jgi:hypothetical protein
MVAVTRLPSAHAGQKTHRARHEAVSVHHECKAEAISYLIHQSEGIYSGFKEVIRLIVARPCTCGAGRVNISRSPSPTAPRHPNAMRNEL